MPPAAISRRTLLGVRVAETAVRVEDTLATAPGETAGVGAWPDLAASTRAEPRVLHAGPQHLQPESREVITDGARDHLPRRPGCRNRSPRGGHGGNCPTRNGWGWRLAGPSRFYEGRAPYPAHTPGHSLT
jgi:hypothetical protein